MQSQGKGSDAGLTDNVRRLQCVHAAGTLRPHGALNRGGVAGRPHKRIVDGNAVEVFNERGKIPLRAKVIATVPAGVAASRLGWNKLTHDGQGVNTLTSETLTDLG